MKTMPPGHVPPDSRCGWSNCGPSGEVAEWPNVPDSKSGVPQGTVGSNPTLSARSVIGKRSPCYFLIVLTTARTNGGCGSECLNLHGVQGVEGSNPFTPTI